MTLGWLRPWLVLAFVHRWLGVAGGLLFVVWFVSGVVMVYVRMPELTDDERLAASPTLDIARIRVGPADARRVAGAGDGAAVVLRMLRGRPIYVAGGRDAVIVDADTGAAVPPVTTDDALAAAHTFAGAPADRVRHRSTLSIPDQWTLQLRQHVPLHVFDVDGSSGRELYVSGRTGEVVLDTTRRERLLAYVGPVAHWLYLPVLRRNGAVWSQAVIWASALGCVLCVTGLVAGLWRFSPRRGFRVRRAPAASPYDGWLKWHHYAGLLFGVVTFTWTFSGLLSMGPFSPL